MSATAPPLTLYMVTTRVRRTAATTVWAADPGEAARVAGLGAEVSVRVLPVAPQCVQPPLPFGD